MLSCGLGRIAECWWCELTGCCDLEKLVAFPVHGRHHYALVRAFMQAFLHFAGFQLACQAIIDHGKAICQQMHLASI